MHTCFDEYGMQYVPPSKNVFFLVHLKVKLFFKIRILISSLIYIYFMGILPYNLMWNIFEHLQ